MKNQFDVKSMVIGFLSAALLLTAFSFKNESNAGSNKYQTAVGGDGVVILDTETGAYIINTDLTNAGWRKGYFGTTFEASKDNINRK